MSLAAARARRRWCCSRTSQTTDASQPAQQPCAHWCAREAARVTQNGSSFSLSLGTAKPLIVVRSHQNRDAYDGSYEPHPRSLRSIARARKSPAHLQEEAHRVETQGREDVPPRMQVHVCAKRVEASDESLRARRANTTMTQAHATACGGCMQPNMLTGDAEREVLELHAERVVGHPANDRQNDRNIGEREEGVGFPQSRR